MKINGGQEMNQSQRQGSKGSLNNSFDILELNLGVICAKQDLCVPVESFLFSVTFHSVAVGCHRHFDFGVFVLTNVKAANMAN